VSTHLVYVMEGTLHAFPLPIPGGPISRKTLPCIASEICSPLHVVEPESDRIQYYVTMQFTTLMLIPKEALTDVVLLKPVVCLLTRRPSMARCLCSSYATSTG